MATAPGLELLTAEEFAARPYGPNPEELVRGRIISVTSPGRRHGIVCNAVGLILGLFVREHRLGHVLNNDSGVITERGPDSVRGPDVAYYSHARLPKELISDSLGPEIPEIVVEVRSPSDRWNELQKKALEYLNAGVIYVVVLDPAVKSATVFHADKPPKQLGLDDELSFPGVLDGFGVKVREFLE